MISSSKTLRPLTVLTVFHLSLIVLLLLLTPSEVTWICCFFFSFFSKIIPSCVLLCLWITQLWAHHGCLHHTVCSVHSRHRCVSQACCLVFCLWICAIYFSFSLFSVFFCFLSPVVNPFLSLFSHPSPTLFPSHSLPFFSTWLPFLCPSANLSGYISASWLERQHTEKWAQSCGCGVYSKVCTILSSVPHPAVSQCFSNGGSR